MSNNGEKITQDWLKSGDYQIGELFITIYNIYFDSDLVWRMQLCIIKG